MLKELVMWITNNIQARLENTDKTQKPLAVVPDGLDIHSLEQYMEFRSRFRGTFSTPSLDAFVAYTAARSKEATTCFVDTNNGLSAHAIFDLGNDEKPGHCDNNAALALPASPEYKAFTSIDGAHQSQRDAAEWLEDWRDCITFLDPAGETIEQKAALTAMRNIQQKAEASSTSSEQQFSSSRSTFEQIEVNTSEVNPAYIVFKCEPYPGLDVREFHARISLPTSTPQKVIIRSIRLDSEIEKMGEELVAKLSKSLEGTSVYQGKFKS